MLLSNSMCPSLVSFWLKKKVPCWWMSKKQQSSMLKFQLHQIVNDNLISNKYLLFHNKVSKTAWNRHNILRSLFLIFWKTIASLRVNNMYNCNIINKPLLCRVFSRERSGNYIPKICDKLDMLQYPGNHFMKKNAIPY